MYKNLQVKKEIKVTFNYTAYHRDYPNLIPNYLNEYFIYDQVMAQRKPVYTEARDVKIRISCRQEAYK